jgi:hypothetical protein
VRKPYRQLACLLCFTLFLAVASVATAAPHLTWHSDTVYFDHQGRIIIEGYFYNDGTHTVTWVNRHDLQVYLRQDSTNWWLHAAGTFYDLNLYLLPGDSQRWTFRITGVDYVHFDHWNVKWNVNYKYQNYY